MDFYLEIDERQIRQEREKARALRKQAGGKTKSPKESAITVEPKSPQRTDS